MVDTLDAFLSMCEGHFSAPGRLSVCFRYRTAVADLQGFLVGGGTQPANNQTDLTTGFRYAEDVTSVHLETMMNRQVAKAKKN